MPYFEEAFKQERKKKRKNEKRAKRLVKKWNQGGKWEEFILGFEPIEKKLDKIKPLVKQELKQIKK
jgi:hypothetical protein